MQEVNIYENLEERNDIYENQEPENDIYENFPPDGENHYEIVDGFNPNENITAKERQKRKILITTIAGIIVIVSVFSSTLSLKLRKPNDLGDGANNTRPVILTTYLENITTLQPKVTDSTVPTTRFAEIIITTTVAKEITSDAFTTFNQFLEQLGNFLIEALSSGLELLEFLVEFFLLYNANNPPSFDYSSDPRRR